MDMSDEVEELCRRAKEGEMEAASRLVTLYHQRIYAFFARLCRTEDAEDLTERTFFKVWTSIGKYDGRSSFSTWLHAIAHHVYVDWRRKRNPTELQSPEWWETLVSEEPNPFENAAERDLASRLYRLVDLMDSETRELVHLHYYQHLSIKEVSEVLDIATSTVKYRLRQALDFLRTRAMEPRMQKIHPTQTR
jgi:RNA polymerase sigma-70 factor (ECF subfamily)